MAVYGQKSYHRARVSGSVSRQAYSAASCWASQTLQALEVLKQVCLMRVDLALVRVLLTILTVVVGKALSGASSTGPRRQAVRWQDVM